MSKQKSITGPELMKQLSPWLSHGAEGETDLTYEGRIRWLNIEHPGWHVSAGQIITLDTGVLAIHETPDNGERQVGRLTSYIVSGYVMDGHGNIIATGFSDEYRAYDWEILKDDANGPWVHIHARQAIIRALEYVGISSSMLSMILKHGITTILEDEVEDKPVTEMKPEDLPPVVADVIAPKSPTSKVDSDLPKSVQNNTLPPMPESKTTSEPLAPPPMTPPTSAPSMPPLTQGLPPMVPPAPPPMPPVSNVSTSNLPPVVPPAPPPPPPPPPPSTPSAPEAPSPNPDRPVAFRIKPEEITSASWTTMNKLFQMWTTIWQIDQNVSQQNFDGYIRPFAPQGSSGISIPDPEWDQTPPQTQKMCLDIARQICARLNRDMDALGL